MTQNEFSHEIRAEAVGSTVFKAKFKATPEQCARLATRFDILSVENVEGTATLKREADGFTIHASGSFTANVTQACVTTLAPVPEHIAETFEAWYLDESQVASIARARKTRKPAANAPQSDDSEDDIEENPMPDEQDDPETIVNGIIDIGELVAQHLSLALSPFPHSDAAKASGPMGDEADLKPESPFASLKDLL